MFFTSLRRFSSTDVKSIRQWYEKKQAFRESRCSNVKNIRQYKKIEENRCSDVKNMRQHQAKMNADVKI